MDKYQLQRKWIKIKDSLFNKKNRELLVFFVFFCISSVFWLLQTLNESFDTEIAVPMRLTNVPSDVVITTDLPEELKVTVHDKGTVLMRYLYAQKFNPILVNYDEYSSGGVGERVSVDALDVRRVLQSSFMPSTKIVSVKPDTLEFFYNRGEHKRLPVRVAGVIETIPQYYLRDVSCIPDSVDVYAPPYILDTMTAVYSQTLYITDLADKCEERKPLKVQKGVKYEPDNVRILMGVDVYTEKTVEVPIVGVNFPASKDLRTFPSKVSVTFRVGSSRYKSITADDFVLAVTYEELLKNKYSKYKLHLWKTPPGVTSVRIHPAEVDYLIEQTMEE